ncbi:MAG: XdhC family protein, partial [Pseudomonadota bacterium]
MLDVDSPALRSPVPDPIRALAEATEPAVLCVIAGVEGPSYRPVGACMAVMPEAMARVGTLSSGCVEADVALHAAEALQAGRPRAVRYGRGSPFLDIQLPCGGGLDILLVPVPARAPVLADLVARQAARQVAVLEIDTETGALALRDAGETGYDCALFRVRFTPELRFLTFGKGPEASTFAALVQAAGYPNVLVSPDAETLDHARAAGCAVAHVTHAHLPEDLPVDPWSAVILFFHDHDWEPPILASAVATPAFYIGSQGSRKAREARMLMLEVMGLSAADRARIRGPIGLVPSARDARTLAVSVLAEVLDTARSSDFPFTYSIPVTALDGPGAYRVKLYIAEVSPGAQSAGFRIFDSTLEGAVPTPFNDIDPVSQFGTDVGVLMADVTVIDGSLDIGFVQDVVQNPIINGIEIIKLGGDASDVD